MDWLQVVTLALIQGVTEFLPISSSAHLILPAQLTDWPDQGLAFDVAVHVGTLLAVVTYFRAEVFGAIGSAGTLLTERRVDATLDLWLKIAAATVPIVVFGFLAKDFVETQLRTVPVIAFTTIAFGLLLAWADRRHGQLETVTWSQAIVIGLAQVLAIVPGTSRSGITMTAALLLMLSRTSAARFSMLLSVPTIVGAALLLVKDVLDSGVDAQWDHLAAGALVSGISAFLSIGFFMALVERTGMLPYVIYRLLLWLFLILFLL